MIVIAVILGLVSNNKYLWKIMLMSIITHGITIAPPNNVIDNCDDDDDDDGITYHMPRTL